MDPYIAFSPGKEHPGKVLHSNTSKLAAPNKISREEFDTLVSPRCNPLGFASAVQLDAVALARKAHMEGEACIVGDATGLGKGSIAIAIAANTFELDSPNVRGRLAIYITVKSVFDSVKRDVNAVGLKAQVIDVGSSQFLKKWDRSRDTVLFVPYTWINRTPASTAGAGDVQSHQELIERCIAEAPNAKVVPVLCDECHHAKNQKDSKVGAAVMQFLTNMQDSIRLTFLSATFASTVDDLRLYAPFIGFVSDDPKKAPFQSFDQLKGKFKPSLQGNKGPALEFLNAELVRRGRLISRKLSYDNVTFTVETVTLPPDWIVQHDKAAEIFAAVYATRLFDGRESSFFFGSQLRFFKTLALCGKVDRTVEVIKEKVAEGYQAIVSLTSTGEASAMRAAVKGEDEESTRESGFSSFGVRDTLLELLRKAEEIRAQKVVEGAHAADEDADLEIVHGADLLELLSVRVDGEAVPVPVLLTLKAHKERPYLDGVVGHAMSYYKQSSAHDEAVEEVKVVVKVCTGLRRNDGYEASQCRLPLHYLAVLANIPTNDAFRRTLKHDLKVLVRRTMHLGLPEASPLDEMKRKLGGSEMVAELTGRDSVMEFVGGKWQRMQRKTRAADKRAERESFNSGAKKIVFLSLAESTGQSLHAGTPSSAQRVHFLSEVPWSAEQIIQQLGRSHRSNQSSAPQYVLMATNQAADVRFLSTVSAKLSELGAISSGDRGALTSQSCLEFCSAEGRDAEQFVDMHANRALRQLYQNDAVFRGHLESFGFSDPAKMDGKRFMNRLLAAPFKLGQELFSEFDDAITKQRAIAEQQGVLSLKVETYVIDGTRVKVDKIEDSERYEPKIYVLRKDSGISFADARAIQADKVMQGNAPERVYFAVVSNEPTLVWFRTQRGFVRFTPAGEKVLGSIDKAPDRVVPDAAFQDTWAQALQAHDNKEPRVVFRRILMLPSLQVIADLQQLSHLKLARIQHEDGQTTLGVDFGDGSMGLQKALEVGLGYITEKTREKRRKLREAQEAHAQAQAQAQAAAAAAAAAAEAATAATAATSASSAGERELRLPDIGEAPVAEAFADAPAASSTTMAEALEATAAAAAVAASAAATFAKAALSAAALTQPPSTGRCLLRGTSSRVSSFATTATPAEAEAKHKQKHKEPAKLEVQPVEPVLPPVGGFDSSADEDGEEHIKKRPASFLDDAEAQKRVRTGMPSSSADGDATACASLFRRSA